MGGDREDIGTIRTTDQSTAMITGTVWLTKLLTAHLLTDFVLQPASWVADRKQKHFASWKLYWHVLLTAAVAYLLIGWSYWLVALVILVSHLLIDGWKSYRPERIRYFLTDQLLHLAVTAGCWWFSFPNEAVLGEIAHRWSGETHHWVVVAGFVFVTSPAGI